MFIEEEAEKTRILAAFAGRRRRELWVGISATAACGLAILMFERPEFEIDGFGGLPLLLIAIGVTTFGLLHHLVNWRCPACGRPFWRGIDVSVCLSCGAVLKEGRPGADPAVERREQTELALKKAAREYGDQRVKAMGLGALLIGAGAAIVFFMDDPLRAPGWLYRAVGDSAPHILTEAVGGLFILFGLIVLGLAIRSATVGARRDAEEARRRFFGENEPRR